MLEPVFHILAPDGWIITVQAVLLAYVLDWIIGDPKWLYARISHPVVLIGGLISALEARLRDAGHSPDRQIIAGLVLVAITIGICFALMMFLICMTYMEKNLMRDLNIMNNKILFLKSH